MANKDVIREILNDLPYSQRKRVEEAGRKYRKAKLEPITLELTEKLYKQVLQEQKERGK